MEHYIIRIYRRGEIGTEELVGTAEEVESREKRAFASLPELWNILNYRRPGPDRDDYDQDPGRPGAGLGKLSR